MNLNSFLPRFSVVLGLLLGTAAAAPAQSVVSTARRIADIASIAVAEYAEGVDDGEIVRREEWNEARLFIGDALDAAGRLAPGPRARAVARLEELEAAIAGLRPEPELRAALAGLRRALEAAVGEPLDPFPETAPSRARGAELYGSACRQCHGSAGAGDGPLARDLNPPPADLTDAEALAGTSPVEFFRKINVGVAGTGMPAFAEQFDLDDRWALALYASTLRFGKAPRDHGAELLARRCADCPLWLSDFGATAALPDDSLAARLTDATGLEDDSAVAALVAYGRVAAARELLGGERRLAVARTVDRTRRAVAEVERLVEAGEREAGERRAVDAYLIFEGIESGVRARDPGLARRLERAFADLRGAAQGDDRSDQLAAARRRIDAGLSEALAVTTAKTSLPVLFGQSLVIMVREGLEAILIIGALIAFLTKAGAGERKRDIGWGVLAALGVSGLTALGFATLFRSATAHQEVLEGVTMLLAAAVLFWVSYWLVSKIEVRKWQGFVRRQMGKALSSRRMLALAAVAFLAVYREGFETVLFYAALFATAEGATGSVGAIVAGMVLGGAILGLVYYVIERYGVRIPLKPFFAVTSTFLYIMAFSFAGQGVAELQAAGLISVTPLDWLPALPALGVFPTIQTLLSQSVLALAVVLALVWVFWIEPRTSGAQA